MSVKEPDIIAYIINRAQKTVFVGLFRLYHLGIDHLRFQVGVELV